MPGSGPRRASGTAAPGHSYGVSPKRAQWCQQQPRVRPWAPPPPHSSERITLHTPSPQPEGPWPAPVCGVPVGAGVSLLHEALIPATGDKRWRRSQET